MYQFSHIIILAILVESIWNNLKLLWDSSKFNWNKLGVLLLSVVIAVFTKQDIFLIINLPFTVPLIRSNFNWYYDCKWS